MKTVVASQSVVSLNFIVLSLSLNYVAGSASFHDSIVPKVSVRVSTSSDQSSQKQSQQISGKFKYLSGAIAEDKPVSINRDVRSNQESHYLHDNTEDGLNNYRKSITLITTRQPELVDLNQKQLNSFGRIWELPEYRQSVSSSFTASGPIAAPTNHQQPTYDSGIQILKVNNQVPRSVINWNPKAKDCAPQGRSLGKILRRAKHLITDSFVSLERFASSGSIMFGSSLLAAAIPLAVALMPDVREKHQPSQLDETTLSRFGLQSRVDSLMGWIERSVDHLPHVPHLHPQECLKRSICEAHSEPKKYGAIGFALRLFFPATNVSITERMDNMDYKVINKYRHAAGFGQSRRLDGVNGTGDPAACKLKYDDCLVSLLDIARHLMDMFLQ